MKSRHEITVMKCEGRPKDVFDELQTEECRHIRSMARVHEGDAHSQDMSINIHATCIHSRRRGRHSLRE